LPCTINEKYEIRILVLRKRRILGGGMA